MIQTLTAEKIHFAIAQKINNGSTYIDALVEYAHLEGIEIETIAAIVRRSPVIKELVRTEAIKLKTVKHDDNSEPTRLCD